MKKLSATLITLLALASSAVAATQTVTLSVPGMDCATCPITVKKALTKVNGVSNVKVDFDKKLAVVVFDDAKATISALTDATKNAGYPASIKP
jgi:mercuric ion binding protein